MFTHQRPGLSLNGTWKFNPDPMQRCRQQQWWKHRGTDDSFFPCWDPAGLWEIQVPGTWKTQFDELKWYDGHANYVRDFEAPVVGEDQEAFLVFDGVCYAAEVYLNGQSAGRHDWGYSPFVCRVTELLREENQLFVLVDSHLSADRVPGVRFDWNNDGGILNGVKLVITPKVYVENFRTQTTLDDGRVAIDVEVFVQGRDRAVSEDVTVSIPELDLETSVTVAAGGSTTATFSLPRSDIRLWSPDDPKLYDTRVTTRFESLHDDIGYRELRTAGQQVLLNGEPIRLHGVCVHSEFPDTGRTATVAGIDQMIDRVKDLGCNFVRCAHYPYAEIFGRAMDRAGLLWWEEVPVYWLANIHHAHMSRQALGMLKDTVLRDWNRASLAIWSVSNECAGSDSDGTGLGAGNYPYWKQAVELVRELDPSRLVSSADAGHRRTLDSGWVPDAGDAFDQDIRGQQWAPGHPDSFYDLLDILAGNVYVSGLGEGPVAYRKFVQMLERYNKPLMISEFGSMSLRGSDERPDVSDKNLGSEARHVQILDEAYGAFCELPQISGVMPWCLVDVRVPMHWRWYNAGQGVFRYGLLDEHWREKQAFTAVRRGNAAMTAAFGRSATARAPR